jgi:hypothetical protein
VLNNALAAQPPFPALIDWNNPLTKGLVAVIDRGTVNPVNGRAYSVSSNFYTYTGAFDYSPGRALSSDGTGGSNTVRLVIPTNGISTQSFSIAGKIRTRSAAGVGVGIRAGTNNILLWRNSGWDMRVGGTDYTAAGTYNLNQVYDYALTSGSSAVDLYVDGVSTIAGGAGGAGTLSDTDVFSDSSGGGAQYIDIWWLGVWNRKLTAQEVWQLKVNPWQIFKAPPKYMFVAPSTGAATHTTTGSLTGQGSTVSGTATHKTRHTTSGALTGPGSSIAGVAKHPHVSSGVLTGQGASVVGTATHIPQAGTHTTSGALTGSGSTVSGTSVHKVLHTTSGSLVGPGAAVVGTASNYTVHTTSGVLNAGNAIIVGTASRGTFATHATSGNLTGQGATVSGESSQQTLTQADLVAIANAVWNRLTDTTYTSGDLLRLIAAMAAGRVSGAQTGTETFRDVGNTKNRIVATVDSKGNRTSITLDAS